MAQTIQLKRSAQSGKVPDTGSLNLGELAVNTYDGKIFFKKSGSIESIQSVVTTNSITTGSIELIGAITASIAATNGVFSGSSQIVSILTSLNSVSSSLISKTGSYATTGSNSFIANQQITGSLGVSGDVTVLGAINARQFNIGIISSSILYQSGSNKFGDTTDDTHQFTGSVGITGSLLINGVAVGGSSNSGSFTGSFSGSFIGDGSGLRGVVSDDLPIDGWDYQSNSSASISNFNVTSSKYLLDFQWDAEMGSPVGYKGFIGNYSGSTQVVPTDSGVKFIVGDNLVATIGVNGIQASAPAGTVSGSSQLTSSYDARYVLSGSITQTTWDNIASKPGGIVSGSSQIVGILSSLNTYTASVSTASIENRFITLQNVTSSLISATGSYATTGSNTFNGNETISGSLFVSGTTEFGGDLVPKFPSGSTLGTQLRPFKGIFVSSGSINIASDRIGDPNTTLSNVSGNILISAGGMQLLGTGSFNAVTASFSYLSGSFTHIGAQYNIGDIVTTGSLAVSGSTVMIGNNTMQGNTLLSGSFGITGSTSFSELGNTSLLSYSSSVSSKISAVSASAIVSASSNTNVILFTKGDGSTTQVTVATGSATFVTSSFGSFHSSYTQSGSANTAYVMKLDGADHQDGVILSGSGGMKVLQAGTYDIEFSAQLVNGAGSEDVDIWFRKNGIDVDNSNTRLTIASNQKLVAAWNWQDTANPNDVFEIMWSSTSGNSTIAAFGTGTSPTRPAIPSVIATLHRIDVGGGSNMISNTQFNPFTASINSFTSSAASRFSNLEIATSSYETIGRGIISSSAQLNGTTITNLTITNLTTVNETASVLFSSGSNRFGDFGDDIHSFTGSVKISGSITTIGSSTATSYNGIINATNGVVSGSSQVIGILSSLNTYTASQDTKNSTLQTYTASLDTKNLTLATYTASLETKNLTLATYTASLETKNSTLASYTGSNDTKWTTLTNVTSSLISATGSYETKGRGIVSGSSQVDVLSTTNIARLATTGSNTFSSANTFSNTVNVQNFLSISSASTLNAPSSGKSIEMVYRVDGANDYAFIQTYDRTNSVFKPLRISASTLSLNGGGEGNVGFGLTNAQSQVHLNGTITFTESGFDTVRKHTITHGHSDGSSPNNYVAINVSDGTGTTAERIRVNGSGQLLPAANGTQDLGSASLRWSTIYTSDLSLNNGIGDWTIVEGEDDLFLYNNKKGKVYKFALTEVDPNVATPKKS